MFQIRTLLLLFFCVTFSLAKEPSIRLLNEWRDGGGEFSTVTVHRTRSFCFFSGVIRGKHKGRFAALGPAFHPAFRQIFPAASSTWPLRVEIDAQGDVHWFEGDDNVRWMSLSNVVYSTYRGKKLTLPPDVYSRGGNIAAPYVVKEGNICVLGGSLAASRWGHMATLPANCRPRARLVFNVNNGNWPARVDILPDGKVLWVGGHGDKPWLSLGGICYSTVGGEPLILESGWKDLKRGHQQAYYLKQQGIVLLGGSIKPGKWDHIATLLRDFRPTRRLVFLVNNGHQAARIDITADGRILFKRGIKRKGWLSLDGIVFSPEPLHRLPQW